MQWWPKLEWLSAGIASPIMPHPPSEFEAENRPRWTATLLHYFPAETDAIAHGWDLLDLLSDRSENPSSELIRRFMHRKIALIGDSLNGVRFNSRDGDFNSGGAYIRVAIYPGEPPPQPHCTHYEVCVLGTVHAVLWPFSMVALLVPAEKYIVHQTF